MIPYHGTPITSSTVAIEALQGGHGFVSYRHKQQLGLVMAVCQSFALDNGAFSAWRSGAPIQDWSPYYEWVKFIHRHPGFDWAVIPDVIDGDEPANDKLVDEWPLAKHLGVPVWHMHESLARLKRLCQEWPRVAFGSSGAFATVGTSDWWDRVHLAFHVICEAGLPIAKIHGLRMLNPKVFSRLPFASADSTNIAQNVGKDVAWRGTYQPPTKEARARVMRSRIEHWNSAQSYVDPRFE